MIARAALPALLLASGCALFTPSLPPLTCPGRGGPAWTEVSSPHFVLRTDLSADEARRIVADLEPAYDAIEQALRSDLPDAPPPPPTRIRIVIFRDGQDVGALFAAFRRGGFFSANGSGWEPTPVIVMSGRYDDHGRILFRHEITHRLVAHYLPTAPAWLNEGLAQLFSTVRVDGGAAVIGGWHDDLEKHGYQPNVRELFAAPDAQFVESPGYYTEAHALVHLLQSERRGWRARFVDYLRRLDVGMRDDLAWRASFPGVDLDGLERAINRYRFLVLRYDTRRVPLAPRPPAELRVRAMSDAEVHLLWVSLRSLRRSDRDFAEARRDVEEARRQAPDSPETLEWSAWLDFVARRRREAAGELERALARAPTSHRLLYAYEEIADRSARLDELARVAVTADELRWVALSIVQAGRPEALDFARRAAFARPACTACWQALARLAFHFGRIDEAARAAERAAWLAPGRGDLLEQVRWIARVASEAGLSLPPSFGDIAPPPAQAAYGVKVRGRIESRGGPPARGWVLGTCGARFSMVRTGAGGDFELTVPPCRLSVWAFSDDGALLDDHWVRALSPSPRPIELGTFPLVAGRLAARPPAFDGIAAAAVDGRTLIARIQDGSPAALAGLRVGDRLLRVNGHDVDGLGPRAVDFYLAGEVGAETTVEVLPRGAGAPRTVTFRLAPTGLDPAGAPSSTPASR